MSTAGNSQISWGCHVWEFTWKQLSHSYGRLNWLNLRRWIKCTTKRYLGWRLLQRQRSWGKITWISLDTLCIHIMLKLTDAMSYLFPAVLRCKNVTRTSAFYPGFSLVPSLIQSISQMLTLNHVLWRWMRVLILLSLFSLFLLTLLIIRRYCSKHRWLTAIYVQTWCMNYFTR